jgi:DNA-binding MarR family transcriptional regulator
MASSRFNRSYANLPTLDRFLTYRLHMLHKLSDRASHELYLKDSGLGLGEARCLAAVGSFDALSVNRLAFEANLDKGQASRAAQSLVDQGLISKSASENDARSVDLKLTESGRQRWTQVMDLINRRNHEIFGCLSLEERRQLGDFFDRLIDHARGLDQDRE